MLFDAGSDDRLKADMREVSEREGQPISVIEQDTSRSGVNRWSLHHYQSLKELLLKLGQNSHRKTPLVVSLSRPSFAETAYICLSSPFGRVQIFLAFPTSKSYVHFVKNSKSYHPEFMRDEGQNLIEGIWA